MEGLDSLLDLLALTGTVALVALVVVLVASEAFALLDRLGRFLGTVRARRHGGITFFRAGRYRASFCVSNRNLEA